MDVGGVLTVTLSDAKTRNDIGMAILAKQMDTEEQAGVAMIDMMNKSFMEKSVNPKVGGNIDISIWKWEFPVRYGRDFFISLLIGPEKGGFFIVYGSLKCP